MVSPTRKRRKLTSDRVASATDNHRHLERQARVDEHGLFGELADADKVEQVSLEHDDLLAAVAGETENRAGRLDELEDRVLEAKV